MFCCCGTVCYGMLFLVLAAVGWKMTRPKKVPREMSQSNITNFATDLLFTVCGYLNFRETCLLRVVSRRVSLSDQQAEAIHPDWWIQLHPDWSSHQDLVVRAIQLRIMTTNASACSGCGYLNPQEYFYSPDTLERYCTWCTYDDDSVLSKLDEAVYYRELYP
jgi:hypothetical protein